MKTNTAATLRVVKRTPIKRHKTVPHNTAVRKEIRTEAKFITFISHLNLLTCFSAMVILSILDGYIEDFIVGMNSAGSVSIGLSASIASILVFVLGCLMTIFSFVMYLFLNASAQNLRNCASSIKEV